MHLKSQEQILCRHALQRTKLSCLQNEVVRNVKLVAIESVCIPTKLVFDVHRNIQNCSVEKMVYTSLERNWISSSYSIVCCSFLSFSLLFLETSVVLKVCFAQSLTNFSSNKKPSSLKQSEGIGLKVKFFAIFIEWFRRIIFCSWDDKPLSTAETPSPMFSNFAKNVVFQVLFWVHMNKKMFVKVSLHSFVFLFLVGFAGLTRICILSLASCFESLTFTHSLQLFSCFIFYHQQVFRFLTQQNQQVRTESFCS